MDSSSDEDDESKVGLGPLDHLLDIGETVPGASASGLTSPGGGGEGTLGLVIACRGAEADTPEARALGKRAVSPRDPMAEMERAMTGVIQPPP